MGCGDSQEDDIQSAEQTQQNDNEDSLIYVEIYHRHGDRTPSYSLLQDSIEASIWIPMIANHYKWIEYDSVTKKPQYLVENKDEVFSWPFINQQLKFTEIVGINDGDDIKDKSDNNYTVEHWDDIKWQYLLTNTGIMQLNETGQYLRQRYINELKFISNNLQESVDVFKDNIYYQSTNDTRNVFSAESLLEGLIGLNKAEINWKIPIHIDAGHNYYFNPYETKPRSSHYKALLNKNSQFVLNNYLMPEIQELKNKIVSKFNDEDNNHSKIEFYEIQDSYICLCDHMDSDDPIIRKEKENGIIDSELAASFQKLQYKHTLYEIANDARNNAETLKLAIGNQLYSLYNNVRNSNDDDDTAPKCRIYSGHDSTLYTLLCALNKNEENIINLADIYEWPPYGVPMCFEVWKRKDGTKYLKVIYNKKQITINGKNEMTIQELGEFWKDIMIST